MMHTGGERTIEKYNIFPYIAWATFIAFALFVYGVTVQLRETTENLNESTIRLNSIVNAENVLEVEDLESR